MKAIVYDRYGSADELYLTDLPKPTPGRKEVLVHTRAISMNPRDVVFRKGGLKPLTGFKFPKLTGSDVSGIVEAVGPGVTRFKPGDAVFGYTQDLVRAVSAEYVNLPEKYLARKPESISHSQAACLGCAYLTAMQGLRDKADLKAGQKVLVYGASGGVGTAVIQLGKHMGAEITAVSNSRNRDHCLQLGADEFIAYDQEDVFAMGRKYDVFYQVYSDRGLYYQQAKRILPRHGTFITLIPNPLFEFRRIMARPRFEYIMVKTRPQELEELAHLTAQGILSPYISKQLRLEEMAEAHRLVQKGHTLGKIVVRNI